MRGLKSRQSGQTYSEGTAPSALRGRLSACIAASLCLLRGIPMFFAARPRTPLRVLCVVAFDAICVLKTSVRLTPDQRSGLSALLDLGACLNDRLDGTGSSESDASVCRRLIDDSGLHLDVDEYIRRLTKLETDRPQPHGDDAQFVAIRAYRESVVRLSLATLYAACFDDVDIDAGVTATRNDQGINVLFRIVMLCQIIDDITDYATDCEFKLPSFLTAHRSVYHSLALTSYATKGYEQRGLSSNPPHLFPFHLALRAASFFVRSLLVCGLLRCKFGEFRRNLRLAPE